MQLVSQYVARQVARKIAQCESAITNQNISTKKFRVLVSTALLYSRALIAASFAGIELHNLGFGEHSWRIEINVRLPPPRIGFDSCIYRLMRGEFVVDCLPGAKYHLS